MKNFFFKCLAICACIFFTQTANAQSAGDEAAVKAFWKNVWDAYDAGDTEKMWAAYTEDAAEISPDGHLTQGKKALRENWDMFMKMVDAPPKFSYENPAVRMLSSELAILTWDSNTDVKIHGQQMGGETKGMAVVRKIKGQWKVEFDSITPVMEMPAPAGN